ncbi:MAG: MCE family protein, partial [Deltaproteobacteria bacterium]|nr:MCE family protein [Deltaproteobacteria bacterium]
ERSLFGRTYTLVAPFEEVSGLRQGAQVQLSGLNAGYVDGVRFSQKTKGLDVVLKISTDFKNYIRQDSQASIQTQGLLGDKFILITRGSSSQPVLDDGDILKTEGLGGLGAIAEKGKKMMDEIASAAEKFREALEKVPLDPENRKAIQNILKDMEVIVADMREGKGTIGALLRDPALYHDARALMGRANRSKLLKNLIRASIAEQEKATQKPLE